MFIDYVLYYKKEQNINNFTCTYIKCKYKYNLMTLFKRLFFLNIVSN